MATKFASHILVLCLTGVFSIGDALICYQCQNIVSSASGGLLPDSIALNVNPSCDHPTQSAVDTVTCPDDYYYKCASVQGTIKGKLLGSDVKFSVMARDCVKTTESNGCHSPNNEMTSLLNDVLGVLLTDSSVDGAMCYCNDYLCDPSCTFLVISTCLPEWSVFLMLALAGLLGLVLITGCCCCCCCCCCKPCRGPRTTHSPLTVAIPENSNVTYVTSVTPAGGEQLGVGTNRSFGNPLYNYNQQPGPVQYNYSQQPAPGQYNYNNQAGTGANVLNDPSYGYNQYPQEKEGTLRQ